MILIVCVDDHNGMMFNHRRQSQDRVLRADILELTDGKKIWMNAYSRKQFAESDAEKIMVDETFLDDRRSRRSKCEPKADEKTGSSTKNKRKNSFRQRNGKVGIDF